MRIVLVVFDWSGVISDDKRAVYEANMAVLRKFGKPILTFDKWLQESMLDAAELFWKYEVKGTRENLNELYRQELSKVHAKGIIPVVYSDVKDTLEYLNEKKIQLAVVSSHPKENLLKEIKTYGLEKYLPLLIVGSKDKVADLQQIANKLGVEFANCLYIDDTIWGLRAAKKSGFKAAGILTGYHSRERLTAEKPDLILEKLSDLKNIL
jgi:HAD superfamily hydrolase (TIGR01509 family)